MQYNLNMKKTYIFISVFFISIWTGFSQDLSESKNSDFNYLPVYPLNQITTSGTGIANIPTAQSVPKATMILSLFTAQTLSLQNSYSKNQTRAEICLAVIPLLELSGTFGFETGAESLATAFSFAAKATTALSLSEEARLCLGASFRYSGLAKKDKNQIYVPSNNENGLGIAVLTGIQTKNTFSGFTSQCIFSPKGTDSFSDSILLKNSLAFAFTPKETSSFNLFGTLNSLLKPNAKWLKSAETGIETSFLTSKKTLRTTLGVAAVYFIEESTMNLEGHISVAYLF